MKRILLALLLALVPLTASAAFYDRVAMTSATTGTGTITLGSAIPGPYQSFSGASVTNGSSVRYVIVDVAAWEIGLGVYTSSGTTLTRVPSESSNGGSAINLDGQETVFLTPTSQDMNFFASTNLANSFSAIQTISPQLVVNPTAAQTTVTDQSQASGGTVRLPFASTSGIAVGQTVSGTSIPLGDQVASIVATAQITQAANGSFLSGQKVIPMATTAGFATGQQCTDTTKPTSIGAGNVIASIQANTSITMTSNIAATSSGTTDSITCDPVVTMTAASTAAILAGASINFIANATTVSASSALYDAGDASIAGNLNVGGASILGNVSVNLKGTIIVPNNSSSAGLQFGSAAGSPGIFSGGSNGTIIEVTPDQSQNTFSWLKTGGVYYIDLANNVGFGFTSSTGVGSAPDTLINRGGGAGILGLSNSTFGARFNVYSTVDAPTGPTNYSRFYIDTITSATTLNMGTEHGGTGTGITAVNWKVDGTTTLDYGVTTASTWTLSAATTITGIIKNTGITADTGQTDAAVCVVTGTGQFYSGTGTGGICTTASSIRFKRDITPQRDGLDQIIALRPKNFWYKPGYGDNGAREQYGFLAEDMAHALPNLVGLDDEGRPNSVDMLGLVPVLVKAVQQQQAEIRQLRRKEH